MAGILGFLSVLSDDISSLAGKTMATATKTIATSFDDIGLLFDDIATYTKLAGIKSTGIINRYWMSRGILRRSLSKMQ